MCHEADRWSLPLIQKVWSGLGEFSLCLIMQASGHSVGQYHCRPYLQGREIQICCRTHLQCLSLMAFGEPAPAHLSLLLSCHCLRQISGSSQKFIPKCSLCFGPHNLPPIVSSSGNASPTWLGKSCLSLKASFKHSHLFPELFAELVTLF